jgi:large subunit ribosomal protein L4e
MFAPTRVWRKWHRKINTNQKRYATASALAASALPALVMARGHKVDEVPELPLVVDNSLESTQKTAAAYKFLQRFGVSADVDKAKASKKVRRGKGKMRNRRYTMRRGPLVVYNEGNGIEKAFRNLSGVEVAQVDRLNLLQLAPGGHMGRLIVWTQGAFEKLDAIYGTYTQKSSLKADYSLPRHALNNADLARVINSDEVQSVVKPAQPKARRPLRKKNPLKNLGAMIRLNPYAEALRKSEARAAEARAEKKAAALEARRKGLSGITDEERKAIKEKNSRKAASTKFHQTMLTE